jgi:hypothetical protein
VHAVRVWPRSSACDSGSVLAQRASCMLRVTMPAKSPYGVHPSVAYIQNILANFKSKTGRTIDEWIDYVRKEGPKTAAERRAWLKERHQLGTNYAWWIAERVEGKGEEDGDPDAYLRKAPEYVEEMFAGKRAALRPIYDRLLKLGLSVGKEAKACPCKTIVPLYREHVFAEIKPATNTRIDLGLALGNVRTKVPSRIEAVKGPKGNRITHRIRIDSIDQVDAFVEKWMRAAYDADA